MGNEYPYNNFYPYAGFDLMEVGRDEVTLRTGKQANKRNIQFAHQALLALFGKLVAKLKCVSVTTMYVQYIKW